MMMEIKRIGLNDKKAIKEVVDVHMKTFKGFFLTFMGKGFLKQMYSVFVRHAHSGLLCAYSDDKIVGFLAYSENLSQLFKYMIKTRLIPFAWYSLGAFLRKPRVFMRLFRAFLKPAESKREEKYVYIASIGVLNTEKNKGTGTALINELKKTVDFDKFAYIALETDAVNNDSVNNFYVKNGFVLDHAFETHEGRKMNEYRYYSCESLSA